MPPIPNSKKPLAHPSWNVMIPNVPQLNVPRITEVTGTVKVVLREIGRIPRRLF